MLCCYKYKKIENRPTIELLEDSSNNKGSDKNGPNDSGPNDEKPNADRPNNDGAPHEDASNDGDQMKPDPMHCNDRWQSS